MQQPLATHEMIEQGLAGNGLGLTSAELFTQSLSLLEPTRELVSSYCQAYLGAPKNVQTVEGVGGALRVAKKYLGETVQFCGQLGIATTPEDLHEALDRYITLLGDLPISRWGVETDEQAIQETIDQIDHRLQFMQAVWNLGKLAAKGQEASNPQEKTSYADRLRSGVEDLIDAGSCTVEVQSFGETLPPTWQNMHHVHGDVEVTVEHLYNTSYRDKLRSILKNEIVLRAVGNFQGRLLEVGEADTELFEKQRLQYGAKAAGLLALQRVQARLKALGIDSSMPYSIPSFTAIGVAVFDRYRRGEDVDNALLPFYVWTQNLRRTKLATETDFAGFMVRSSAVHSEDGEHLTGAGVYHSVQLGADNDYETFKTAILQVYASVNSPKAKHYRAEHGVGDEQMGVVLQELVTGYMAGTVTTALPGVPQLMEIVSRQSRNLMRKQTLDRLLGISPWDVERLHEHGNLHHYLPDTQKVDPQSLYLLTFVAAGLERIFDKEVQLEYVMSGTLPGARIPDIVQIRPLTYEDEINAPQPITFPDLPIAHQGAAIGFGDETLEVLSTGRNNSRSHGVVIINTNYEWTNDKANLMKLPKSGAVVILESERVGVGGNVNGRGHIQLICSEKGLRCIFPVPGRDGSSSISWETDAVPRSGRLRIVTNGIEGRIYTP